MTAADKIAEARALIEPLTGHTPGPWIYYADLPSTEPTWHIVTTVNRMRVLANVHIEPGNVMDVANAALIAAAPDLRDTVATLADLADAQAQEIARLRAENERLRNMAQLELFSQVFTGSHRHIKSGGLYDHIGTGRIQSDVPLSDMDDVEIYIGVRGDLWARRQVEFHDGRFAKLNIAPATGETS